MAAARILIVEDEILLAKDLARSLKNLGYEIVAMVFSGEEALRVAEESGPDLVLMDIKLTGELDGIQVAHRIRSRYDIPVVYLTGYGEKDVVERAMETEPYGYLGKPSTPLELRSTIETALYKHEADKRVRDSEERYRKLSEATFEGIVLHAEDRILDGNEQFFTMFGYEPHEIIGKDVGSLGVPRESLDAGERQIESDALEAFPAIGVKKSGAAFAMEVRARSTQFNGKTVRVAAIRDISACKNFGEAVRENKEKLDGIVSALTDPMTMMDEQYTVVWTNHAAERLFGTDLVGKKCYREYHGRDGVCDSCSVSKTFSDGKVHEHEVELIAADGKPGIYWCAASVASWHESGRPKIVLAIARDITDRKKAEDALREKEGLLANLFDSIQDGLHIGDTDYSIIRVNKTMERWYSHSMPLVGKKCYEAYHGKSEPCEVCPVRETLKTGKAVSREVPFSGKDGQIRGWIDLHSFPVFDPGSGRLTGIIEHVRDITEHKKAEKALLESEQRFRELAELLPQFVFELDAQGVLTFMNWKGFEALGYAPENFAGRLTMFDALVEEDRERAKRHFSKILEGSTTKGAEYTAQTKTGATFPILAYSSRIVRDGITVGMRGVAIDISDRHRMEQALRDNQERLELALDAGTLALWDWNIKTGGMVMSPRGAEMVGYSPDEMVPYYTWWGGLVNPDDYTAIRKAYNAHVKGLTPLYESEHRLRHKSGRWVWLLSRGKVVERDKDGNPVRMLGIHYDVTKRKKAEQQIRDSLKEKEVMLREIHHRVKNNLAVMSSLLRLQAAYASDEAHRDMFENAQARIRSMALAHELLYQSENLAEIRVREFVGNLVDHLVASTRGIGTPISLKKEIQDVSFGLDTAIPLGFLLTELISNCLKHAFPNEGEGEVRVSFRALREDAFELIVEDNGVGMPEHIDLKNPKSLGLDLVDTFVRQLNGEIEIRRDVGTEVRIRFREPKKEKSG